MGRTPPVLKRRRASSFRLGCAAVLCLGDYGSAFQSLGAPSATLGRSSSCGGQQQQQELWGVHGRRGAVRGRCGARLTPTASLATTTAASTAAVAGVATGKAATATAAATTAAATAATAGSSAAGNLALVASLGVLTLVITLHEVGHLVAALSQGIKVEAFSVGLGPKLLSYRAGSGKGGFFRGTLSGPFSSDSGGAGGGAVVSKPKAEKKRVEAPKPTSIWPAWGKKEEKAQPVQETAKEPEGVEYALRAIPVGGYVSFPNNYEVDDDGVVTELDDPDLLYNSAEEFTPPSAEESKLVTDAKGGAALAGIRSKDVLLSINGNSLGGDSTSVERAVRMIRASEGKPVAIEVARPGSPPTTRMVQTGRGASGKYTVGVLLAPNLESVERRTADNPIEAAGVAFKETAALSTKTLDAFVRLASTGETEDVSGPVEIVKVGAEVAQQEGPSALLQFMAVISINLAVINSLPVPGLDGGQMVFVLAEIVSGKKLDRDVSAAINGVALLILFAISLSTFAGDLGISTLFQRVLAGAVR
eukprot:g11161.t1